MNFKSNLDFETHIWASVECPPTIFTLTMGHYRHIIAVLLFLGNFSILIGRINLSVAILHMSNAAKKISLVRLNDTDVCPRNLSFNSYHNTTIEVRYVFVKSENNNTL